MDKELEVIEGQIREAFGRIVYSHKTHEKCADILFTRQARIKVAQIVLSALTTGSLITTLIQWDQAAAIVGIVLSSLLLILNAYTKDFDLGELAQQHKQSANSIWIVRERYQSLIADVRTGAVTLAAAMSARDDLMEEVHSIYESAPSTNSKAYRKAQAALQRNEEMTFSDGELDAFLPSELRRGSAPSNVSTTTSADGA